MIISPTSRVWGSAKSTSKIEVRVPRPSARPIAATAALEETPLMINPAATSMEPLVTIVGNAWFKDSMAASLISM